MPNLQVIEKVEPASDRSKPASATTSLILHWVVGIVAVFALGTWLVWWAAHLQRHFILDEIRAACQRVMPETVERCVDTVIIQRGGSRR